MPARELPAELAALRRECGLEEALILSTCNRLEFYVSAADPSRAIPPLIDALCARSSLPAASFQSTLYELHEVAAVRHAFSVAAGLDSMILGESEIAAQVKHAYLAASQAGVTGPVLNRLFQKAIHCAKLVRARTRIAEGRSSVGSIVARLVAQLFGERLRTCRVLLWGAGKAAEATTRHLVASGIGTLWIVNRTQAKAQDLASLCRGGWLSWEQAIRHLADVDIAVVCTQAPHYVIDRDDLARIRPAGAARPLCVIDLAVPRNVDPRLKGHEGVCLYDIDDLQSLAQVGLAARQRELSACQTLVDEQVGHFVRWSQTRSWKEVVACGGLAGVSCCR